MEEDGSRAGSRAAAAAFRPMSELVAVGLPPQGRDFPTAAALGSARPQTRSRQCQALAEPPTPPYQTLCLATQNLTQPKEMGHALIAEVGPLVLSLLTDSPG